MRGFSHAHRIYVKSLYKRSCLEAKATQYNRRNDWSRDVAIIRAEFEAAKGLKDPRAISAWIKEKENVLNANWHFDPIVYPKMPGGVMYERNLPPPEWTGEEWAEADAFLEGQKYTYEKALADHEADSKARQEDIEFAQRRAKETKEFFSRKWAIEELKAVEKEDHIRRGGGH